MGSKVGGQDSNTTKHTLFTSIFNRKQNYVNITLEINHLEFGIGNQYMSSFNFLKQLLDCFNMSSQ